MTDESEERPRRLTDQEILDAYDHPHRKEFWPTRKQVAEWMMDARMWGWRGYR